MSSTTNSTPNSTSSAPRYEETPKNAIMANFDTILNVRMAQWREEQKLLIIGRTASQEEKDKLITTQSAELQELLRLCNVPKTRKVLLPIIWDTREVDPMHRDLTKQIIQNLEKGVMIQPFKKGSDVDFHIWKDTLTNTLSAIAGTDYVFDMINEICAQFINNFIPRYSDAHRYKILIMPNFLDETGKIKFGTKFTAIAEAILFKMKSSRTKSKIQQLARKPFWDKNVDNVTKFIKKYESYLRQRLDIQVVSSYLDNSEPLKKAEFLNFLDAIPPIIRREVRFDVNTDVTWSEFTNQYVEAEVTLAYNNPNYRLNKSNKNDNYNKHFIKNNTKNNFTKPNNGSRHVNLKHNTYKNNYNTNYNNNLFHKNDNNNAYRNNNRNNNHNNSNAKSTTNYQNNKSYSKESNFINNFKNNYKNNHKHNNNTGKTQINRITEDTFTESLARKLHEQLINIKYNTMIIMVCIMFILAPIASALPPSYKLEPCNQPMLPTFYSLHKWEANKAYSRCGFNNLVVDTTGTIYERRASSDKKTIKTAHQFISIAKAFNKKCDDEPISTNSAYSSNSDIAKALSFKLPIYGNNKRIDSIRNTGHEYKEDAEGAFYKLQQYAVQLEKIIEKHQNDKHRWLTDDNLLRHATQQAALMTENNKKLESDLSSKKKELDTLKRKLSNTVSLHKYQELMTSKEHDLNDQKLITTNIRKRLEHCKIENEQLRDETLEANNKVHLCLEEKELTTSEATLRYILG